MFITAFKTSSFKVKHIIVLMIMVSIGLILNPYTVFALDIDSSVVDSSRSNYTEGKTPDIVPNYQIIKNASDKSTKKSDNEALPPLPSILQKQIPKNTIPVNQYSPQKNNTINSNRQNVIQQKQNYERQKQNYNPPKLAKLRKGMKFYLTSPYKISDYQPKGTKITLVNTRPIKTPYFTFPVNTKFLGKIEDSHRPQFTCNGGLLVISIDSVVFNQSNQPINAVITKVGKRKVFFNDIKGSRTYLKTTWKKGSWGRALLNQMFSLTASLCTKGSTVLLSPFTFLYGILGYGGNTVISPVIAVFCKGGSAVIPAGTSVTIKLLEDVNIKY